MRDEVILPHYLDYISRIEGIDDKARTEIKKVIKDFIHHEKSGQGETLYDEYTLSRYSNHISGIQGIDDKTQAKIEKVIREFVDYKEGRCNKDTLSCYLDYVSNIQGINNKALTDIHKIIKDFNDYQKNPTKSNVADHPHSNTEPAPLLDINRIRPQQLEYAGKKVLDDIQILAKDKSSRFYSISNQSLGVDKEVLFVPFTRSEGRELNKRPNWEIKNLFNSHETFSPDVSACLIEIKLLIEKDDGHKAVNAAFTVHLIDNKLFVAYNSNSYFQGNGSEELNFNEFDIKMRYIHNSKNYIHISYYGKATVTTKVKYFLTFYLKS